MTDLVPRSNAEAWLRYLRHTTPTLPFKASTQQQRNNLTSHTSPALLNLLKSYKRGKGSITVGVVGYPNVGKSSLINSLKRAKVCAVAAEAGHTKEMQSVQVERGVRVLDSPGVVFDDDEQEASNILLRNVVKVEDISDPIAVVEQILLKTEHSKLAEIYNLFQFRSTLEFLTMLAMTAGRLHKGGTPDILAAARQVIKDWNAHKIPYFSVPPTIHPSLVPSTVSASTSAKYNLGASADEPTVAPGAENVGEAKIVTEFAPAFDLGGLFSQADKGAFGDYDMEGGGGEEEQEYMEEDGNQMISDDLTPSVPRKRSRSPSPSAGSTSFAPGTGTNPPSSVAPSASTSIEPRAKRPRTSLELTYDTSAHERTTMGLAKQNPMNRSALKKSAKAARKAERRRGRVKGVGGGMEVDEDTAGLEFTFMAGVNGVAG